MPPHRTPATAAAPLCAPRGDSVAVLLNAHAKRVTPGVRSAIAGAIGGDNVFLSGSVAEADEIAAQVVEARYPTVFAAGGDGTFVGWVSRIVREAERRSRPVPRFGILALGTGNAVAGLVGARSTSYLEDLRRFARGEARASRRIDLVDCEGRHTPFAGTGTDAALINDYGWLKERLRGGPLRALGHGPVGFALATALRTAPRHLLTSTPRCRIVNVGAPARRLGAAGEPEGDPLPTGAVLFEGPCLMAACSTVPYYGLGMRFFPYAGRVEGSMHLRVAGEIPVPVALLNLPRIWSGAFRHRNLLDFQADRVTVHFDRPSPLQIGGDAEGTRTSVTMGVGPAIEIVDFSR